MKKETGEKLRTSALHTGFLDHVGQHLDTHSYRKVSRALEFAERIHADHVRDDATPYILHPLRTALFLMQELDIYDTDMTRAALLHDVVEDHDQVTHEHIEEDFGARVGYMVRVLTRPDISAESREETNNVYFAGLLDSSEECKLIKLADKLDNLRDSVNCPDPEKRQHTVSEASDFYIPLSDSLTNIRRRQIITKAMNDAIAAAS